MKNLKIILFILFSIHVSSYDRITGLEFATRSEVIAVNGMAATSHPLATQTAISVLRNGGNAIDAAIAANAVLGLVEPTGCGIGGDLFAIVWSAEEQKLFGLNSSGPAPQNISIQKLKDRGINKIPPYGALPVTVPGAVAGWSALHKRFGNLEFQMLFEDAINYAEKGFPLSELIAYYIKRSSEVFKSYENFEEIWMPNGKTPEKGEIFKNPKLADNYRDIASSYGRSFYEDDIAINIVKSVNKNGGYFSLSDLQDYKPEWINPVSTNYRGLDVWELPPNGQGIAALQILNILENFDISKMGFGSAEYIHLFTEAKKIVFEDRAKYYADMDFVKVPVNKLLSDEYANKRRQLIGKRASKYNAGKISVGETIYMTVADSQGTMVSLIQSNYRGMGSGMAPPKLGFMLQDRGELFSLKRGQANTLEPGKRPFHTIIPAFVTKDGKPFLSFGVMGGDFQPMGHTQIIMNLIDFKMNLQEAGDAPRWDHTGGATPTGNKTINTGMIRVESGIPYTTVRGLMDRGHKVGFARGIYGGYQAILWDDISKVYHGASESRKDGQAAGY